MGPPATAPPSVCPSPNGSYPPADCTQYTVQGQSTQTIVRSFPTPTPPPFTVQDAITASIVVHSNQQFHGQSATDFLTNETDAGPQQTITTTDNVYFQFPQAGNILNIGYHSQDSNGVTLDVRNGSGNGIVGQVPTPAPMWTNNASQTIVENDPDGTTTTQTINPDGTYSLTRQETAGTTNAADNPDGSGSASIPSTSFFNFVGTGTVVSVTAPSGGSITFTLTSSGAPTPTPTPIALTVPAWFAPPLAADATTNEGVTSIPVACNTAPTYGTTGIQLHEVKTNIDPVFGIQETQTTDTWVGTVGTICQILNDVTKVYYDFTGQSVPVVSGSGQPIQTTTFNEALGLQSISTAAAGRHALSLSQARAAFTLRLDMARIRAQRMRMRILTRQVQSLESFLRRRPVR